MRAAQARTRCVQSSRQQSLPVQRLGVLVAVMLARERRAPTAATDSSAALAAAVGALPSGVLGMVAEAVAALGYADV